MKIRAISTLLLACLWASSAFADQYSEKWGPKLAEPLPILAANDYKGEPRTFEDLKGENGLLLFMNRSTDW